MDVETGIGVILESVGIDATWEQCLDITKDIYGGIMHIDEIVRAKGLIP